MYGMDSKIENMALAKRLQNNLKNWEIYNLSSVIISRILRILTSQNKFQSLKDQIFKFDRLVE